MVKAVVDIEKELMVVDASLHSDEEAFLIQKGSKQEYLLGINLYPEAKPDEMVEFDSMINFRPSQNNHSRGIDNKEVREKILRIVRKLII